MEPGFAVAKRIVKWGLNLINLDLGKLSEKDLLGLWVEIRMIVYGPSELGDKIISDNWLSPWEERRKEAKEIQDSMKKILDVILKGKVALPSSKFIAGKPVRSIKEEPNLSPTGEPELFSVKNEIGVYREGGCLIKYPKNIKDKVLYDFATALSHVDVRCIQKCQREGCGGYFLKAGEKEKRYCSKKCAWIMASRRHYESEPELLKAKRREYYRRIRGMVSFGPGKKKVEARKSKDERR